MAVSLKKGQKVDLTKTNPGIQHVLVGLGWDINRYDGGHDFDLDTAAFLLKDDNKVSIDTDFVFYNNLADGAKSVVHLGDNRTGEGDGDDEQIKIDLSKVPSHVHRIAFSATIHEADDRGQNFGQVSNAYIRVVNPDSNEELIRYDLGEDFSVETSLVVGEIYRHGSEWKFNAVGGGFQGGLAALCGNFGIGVE